MKPESLVIAGQHTAVNVFLSLVHTARQATKVGRARSRQANLCFFGNWGGRRLESTPRLGLSRNKVAVGEPAAGSPPF